MPHAVLVFLTALVLATAWPGAARADAVAQAEALIAAGQANAARRILVALVPADPQTRARRDLALANAHVEAGDPAAAVPLLDALVSADPLDPRLRLELARALLRAGQRDRARFHMMQARGSSALSAEERAALDGVLAQIEGGKSYEAWARVAIVPETNPGQRTDVDTISIGGLQWALNPGAKASPATGLHVAAGGAFLPRIAPGLRLRLGGVVDARFYSDKALTDVTVRGEFGFQGVTARGIDWSLFASAQDRRVGGKAYGRALGLHGSWARLIGTNAQLRLRADLEDWRFVPVSGQDGMRRSVSAAWSQVLRPDVMIRATVFANRTSARAGSEAGRGAGVSLGVTKLFEGGLIVSLDATYARQRRDAADPWFGVVRRDRRMILSARVMHRTITLRGFAPVLELGLDRQKSTIALNDFRNARVSVGFSREF